MQTVVLVTNNRPLFKVFFCNWNVGATRKNADLLRLNLLCGETAASQWCWLSCFSGASLFHVPTPYFPFPHFLFRPFCNFYSSSHSWYKFLSVQHSTLKWISSYILSPFFSLPRNVTRSILMTWHQTTTDRTWGKAPTVSPFLLRDSLCCGSWTRLALCVFLVHGRKRDEECVGFCSCMQACACLLFPPASIAV